MHELDGRGVTWARLHAEEQIRLHIANSGLRVGDSLPGYRDLAKRLGVSIMTVKRAVGNLAHEGLLNRVERKGVFVARQLGNSAHELRTIGLLVAAARQKLVEQPYRCEIMNGLFRQADILQADVQIFSYWSRQGRVVPAEVSRVCDGVIVQGALSAKSMKGFLREHLPMVVIDYLSERLPLHHIVVNNTALVRSAITRLRAFGHRDLAYVRWPRKLKSDWEAPDTDHIERQAAFQKVARRQRCAWKSLVLEGEAKDRGLWLPLFAALTARSRPSALLFEETGTACMAIASIEAYTKLRVPRDVSVISVAGPKGQNVMPCHVVAQNVVRFQEMGASAVLRLRERCRSLRPLQRTVEHVAADFDPGDTLARQA